MIQNVKRRQLRAISMAMSKAPVFDEGMKVFHLDFGDRVKLPSEVVPGSRAHARAYTRPYTRAMHLRPYMRMRMRMYEWRRC